jgi:hypothetical protein
MPSLPSSAVAYVRTFSSGSWSFGEGHQTTTLNVCSSTSTKVYLFDKILVRTENDSFRWTEIDVDERKEMLEMIDDNRFIHKGTSIAHIDGKTVHVPFAIRCNVQWAGDIGKLTQEGLVVWATDLCTSVKTFVQDNAENLVSGRKIIEVSCNSVSVSWNVKRGSSGFDLESEHTLDQRLQTVNK